MRESTLKRLRQVKNGQQNWRPTPGAMSFVEIARHLVVADQWLFEKVRRKTLESMRGAANPSKSVKWEEYLGIVSDLEEKGLRRETFIANLSESELAERLDDDRFGGPVSVWWIIVRGNLDHEAHHRGQIATYLRMLNEGDASQ